MWITDLPTVRCCRSSCSLVWIYAGSQPRSQLWCQVKGHFCFSSIIYFDLVYVNHFMFFFFVLVIWTSFHAVVLTNLRARSEHALKPLWFCRVTKDNRSAGVLENYKEGEIYRKHSLRRYVADKEPQIMPTINKYFSSESEVYILHGCLQLTHQWWATVAHLCLFLGEVIAQGLGFKGWALTKLNYQHILKHLPNLACR